MAKMKRHKDRKTVKDLDRIPPPQTQNNDPWSQFEKWAGIDWDSNRPALPPKEYNGSITKGCSK